MGWAAKSGDSAKRRARDARRRALMARFVLPVLILRQIGLLVAAILMLPFRLLGLVAGRLWRVVHGD